MNVSETSSLPRGDLLLRKSRRWAKIALASLIITLPCVLFMKPLWTWLAAAGSASFLLVAGLWGLILAGGPLLLLVATLCALFLRVEAGFAPRTRPQPAGDRIFIAIALFVSLIPALAALYPPIKAIMAGTISFRAVGQQYPIATDPLGFWQGVAYWFMGSATLAILAGVYWRGKWRAHKRLRNA